jgi:hypothetical protein
MKRRRHIPDNRLDWRDPAMPVIGKSGREIDHTKMTLKANLAMQAAGEPRWRDDPTYNLRRKDRS